MLSLKSVCTSVGPTVPRPKARHVWPLATTLHSAVANANKAFMAGGVLYGSIRPLHWLPAAGTGPVLNCLG